MFDLKISKLSIQYFPCKLPDSRLKVHLAFKAKLHTLWHIRQKRSARYVFTKLVEGFPRELFCKLRIKYCFYV